MRFKFAPEDYLKLSSPIKTNLRHELLKWGVEFRWPLNRHRNTPQFLEVYGDAPKGIEEALRNGNIRKDEAEFLMELIKPENMF